jgi:hypothetical protein
LRPFVSRKITVSGVLNSYAHEKRSDSFKIPEEAAMKSSSNALETLHYFRKDLELSSNGGRSTVASFESQIMVLADPW